MGLEDGLNNELLDDIDELVGQGSLEEGTPAYGIALQVADKGEDSLTPKQRTIYMLSVRPALIGLHERREKQRILDGNPD